MLPKAIAKAGTPALISTDRPCGLAAAVGPLAVGEPASVRKSIDEASYNDKVKYRRVYTKIRSQPHTRDAMKIHLKCNKIVKANCK